MRNFTAAQPRLLEKIKRRGRLFLMADFDGTLSPIVKRPALAKLDRATKRVLERLQKNRKVLLAVISGRSLKDVKSKVGIKGIIYAGNHGMEISGPGIKFLHKEAAGARAHFNSIDKKLKGALRSIPGALVEHKGLTISIHYRLVRRGDLARMHRAVRKALSLYRSGRRISIFLGKKVYEIRPSVRWDKGRAVKWLLDHHKGLRKDALAVYIGDDRTDEDAFRALRRKGITVRVGDPAERSLAQYYLRGTRDVFEFLNHLSLYLGKG